MQAPRQMMLKWPLRFGLSLRPIQLTKLIMIIEYDFSEIYDTIVANSRQHKKYLAVRVAEAVARAVWVAVATGEGGWRRRIRWRRQGLWGGESDGGEAGRGWCGGEAGGVRVGEEGDGAARAVLARWQG